MIHASADRLTNAGPETPAPPHSDYIAPTARWAAERPRRRAIIGLPPDYGPADVEALITPYVDYPEHDYGIVTSERLGLRVGHVTLPTMAAADAVRMALDGLQLDGCRLAVREAKPSRRRHLRHDPVAQAHHAEDRWAREREDRRTEDRTTARLLARLSFRAAARALGRSLGWVQRSLKRYGRGTGVRSCVALGHLPCPIGVSAAVRSRHPGAEDQRWDRSREHATHNPEPEGNTRRRTAADTPHDHGPDGAAIRRSMRRVMGRYGPEEGA